MRIYYGWYIVAICSLVFALVVGGSIQAFGLFVLPVSEAFGLSRAETNTGAIILNVGMAFASPVLGRILDRHSARRVMMLSAIAFGASMAVLGFSSNIWLSTFIIFVPLSAAVVGSGTLTSPALLARWFVVHRGRAMAIATAGISLGPVAVVPIMGFAIEAVGWRQCLMLAGLLIGALLLLLAILVRDEPRQDEKEPGSGKAEHGSPAGDPDASDKSLTIGQLLKMARFWTVALGSALMFAVLTTDIVSLVPFAQGEGFSITEAAGLMSTYGIVTLIGTLLYAWLGDRMNRIVVFAAMCLLMGASNAALLLAGSLVAMHVCVGFIGFAAGICTPAFLAVIADTFGAASFGIATGSASFASTFMSAIAIRYGGEVFDRTGSYHMMFLSFLVFAIIAAVLVLSTIPLTRRRPG
ncbi:MAG: MFS transporter [Novosphingobium sp.]